ncbi:hypothetical protein PPYR_02514 [Photinus pyralis]|uniref:Angiotensin-converting enzyme n=1 Tax=Photinus pyralis TaxID=7054 RepID=A0A5N4B7L1_PHOPY|nr:angiotensin-converting enzyme-like [Photinus pyralis]KAB0805544.1 hypothetical protein PPYR_02514 [Photinus pyralis]
MQTIFFYLVFVHLVLNVCDIEARIIEGTNTNLVDALQFLREYNNEGSEICFRVNTARWNYATNMTDTNKKRMVDEQKHKAKFDKVSWKKAVTFNRSVLSDPTAKRQLTFLIATSKASLNDEKYNEIHHLISEMKDVYAQTQICPFNNFDATFCNIHLEPDITRLMAHSRNPAELLHVWKEWHDNVGPPLKNKFMRYTQLANQAARMSGFADAGDQMRYVYEDDDFEQELMDSWSHLEELYKELFTYVRRKLVLKYGSEFIRTDGPIPVHLLGDLWGQDWRNTFDIVKPYSWSKDSEVTDEMLKQGFTPLKIYQMAEEFYLSLGLKSMPPEFWKQSIFDKPTDRKIQCTTSAWDFCNGHDFRIKQCTQVDMESLSVSHHEMAHIQYYMYYAEQPYLYREGANPAFHEGLANAIVLSVINPTHLQQIGLVHNNTSTFETSIQFLLQMALRKVAYAPFAYLVDKWRYKVFRDGVSGMNSAWWNLRLRYQGVIPPEPRTDQHLDPAAKKHIPADIPYMNYYVALLLEFQIFEALCIAKGHTGQLHTCDLYRSREAGRILSEAMQVGKARHWKYVIRMITKGKSDSFSVKAILKYFQPLQQWLHVQNANEEIIGWNTNEEDTMLFQPLHSRSTVIKQSLFLTMIGAALLF